MTYRLGCIQAEAAAAAAMPLPPGTSTNTKLGPLPSSILPPRPRNSTPGTLSASAGGLVGSLWNLAVNTDCGGGGATFSPPGPLIIYDIFSTVMSSLQTQSSRGSTCRGGAWAPPPLSSIVSPSWSSPLSTCWDQSSQAVAGTPAFHPIRPTAG